MDFNKKEVEAVTDVQAEVADLSDLQLALIGGGIGETAL